MIRYIPVPASSSPRTSDTAEMPTHLQIGSPASWIEADIHAGDFGAVAASGAFKFFNWPIKRSVLGSGQLI